MTSFRIRPKFQIHLEKDSSTVLDDLRKGLEAEGNPFDTVEWPGHLVLKIKKEKQHYWSPQLNLQFIEADKGTDVSGRYEPHHNVWTLFILCYLSLTIMALFIGIIGFSRLSLGMSASMLWGLPVLAGVAILLYFVSQLGQKLGAEETFDLHHFVERHTGKNIDIR